MSRLRERESTTCLGKENYLETGGHREEVVLESNLAWVRLVDYGSLHLVANIYSYGKQLRDEGGHETTQTLPEGAHLGLTRPTRVTHVTYEDGASQAIRDTRSPDGKATELSAGWKGEVEVFPNRSTYGGLRTIVR